MISRSAIDQAWSQANGNHQLFAALIQEEQRNIQWKHAESLMDKVIFRKKILFVTVTIKLKDLPGWLLNWIIDGIEYDKVE